MSDFVEQVFEDNKFNVLFLGTGVSTALPSIYHVVVKKRTSADTVPCVVCNDGFRNTNSKNRRNNVSIAMTFKGNDGLPKCVMVDAGKTLRDACIRLLPANGIVDVSAILLTHGHADAVLGLDDVRDLQECSKVTVTDPQNPTIQQVGFKIDSGPLPIYLHKETMDTVRSQFGYLCEQPRYLDEANFILERRIALVDFRVIDYNASLDLYGLPIRSFPVYHGGTYISLGFAVGPNAEFVYISDVKIIPEETMLYLKSVPQIEVLVVDCLAEEGIYSHVGLAEALDIVSALQPRSTYFTGMACSLGDHDTFTARLAGIASNVFVAYDGMVLKGFPIRNQAMETEAVDK